MFTEESEKRVALQYCLTLRALYSDKSIRYCIFKGKQVVQG